MEREEGGREVKRGGRRRRTGMEPPKHEEEYHEAEGADVGPWLLLNGRCDGRGYRDQAFWKRFEE